MGFKAYATVVSGSKMIENGGPDWCIAYATVVSGSKIIENGGPDWCIA